MEAWVQVKSFTVLFCLLKVAISRIVVQRESSTEKIEVKINKPWYGDFGLYNHFHQETQGNTVRIVPNFMFGLSQDKLIQMYQGAENVPASGILSKSTGEYFILIIPWSSCIYKKFLFLDTDRLIIQCFMNLVVLSVIFLLWANNPVQKKEALD